MKKCKIIIAAALSLTMTACSDTNTAEVTTVSDVETAESVTTISEETTAKTEETPETSEITTALETSETEVSETKTEIVPTVVTETDENGIMTLTASENTKYYECRIADENIVTDTEKIEDRELFKNVLSFFEESGFYNDIHAEMKTQAAECGYTEGVDYNLKCQLTGAIISDFDGDGKNESAFLFALVPDNDEVRGEVLQFVNDSMTSRLVFADSSGNITLYDEDFSVYSEIKELKYNGFSHLVVSGGHNNMSSKSCIFSVNGNGLKCEFSDGKIDDFDTFIIDRFLLKMTMPQHSNWLVCWNDDIKAYVTVDAVYLDKEESDKILPLLPFDGEFESNSVISVIGGRYYTVCSPRDTDDPTYYNEYTDDIMRNLPYFHITYEFSEDVYARLTDSEGYSIQIGVRPNIDLAYLENFYFDTAVNNIVPIE